MIVHTVRAPLKHHHVRHAVDINPKDYRAWYGLGQTYELLNMYYYALHYYRKVVS